MVDYIAKAAPESVEVFVSEHAARFDIGDTQHFVSLLGAGESTFKDALSLAIGQFDATKATTHPRVDLGRQMREWVKDEFITRVPEELAPHGVVDPDLAARLVGCMAGKNVEFYNDPVWTMIRDASGTVAAVRNLRASL